MSYHATKCSMPTLSPRSRHLLKLWRENFWANLQDSLLDKDRRHERQRLAFTDRRTDRRNGSFFLRLLLSFASCGFHTTDGSLFCEVSKASFTKMMLATSTPTATTTRKANLFESMALGGAAASFAVNFTHPIVRSSQFRTMFVGVRLTQFS